MPDKSNIKNSFLFTITLPYIFFSEEDIEMTMTSPFFSNSKHLQYASIVPGTFNISQWFRSVNFEFNIWSGSEFKIDEGEDMIYFNFSKFMIYLSLNGEPSPSCTASVSTPPSLASPTSTELNDSGKSFPILR